MCIIPCRVARTLFGVLALVLYSATVTAQEIVRVDAVPGDAVVALAAGEHALFAATAAQVYVSIDGGEVWNPASSFPEDTDDLYALEAHAGTLYAGTLGSGVFASPDGGASWQPVGTGLAGDARRVLAFAVRGDSLYAGTEAGIYVLNLQNPGAWTAYNLGLQAAGVRALSASGRMLVASAGPTGSVFVRDDKAPAWTSVPLDAQNTQLLAYEFFSVGAYLLAGTTNGVYRSTPDASAWYATPASLPPSSDVVALTAYGARTYAAVLHQGYAVYASDDQGTTWTLHHTASAAPIFDLMGSRGRLWVARGDGLWYYPVGTETLLFQAALMEGSDPLPVQRGTVLATLEGNDLQLTAAFTGFRLPWGQMDLFDGHPEAGGTLIRNLAIAVPAPPQFAGGLHATAALTEAQVQDAMDGHLYVYVRMTSTNPADHLAGQLQVLPLREPFLAETYLSNPAAGTPFPRGRVLAALEADRLRLVGFFNYLSAPWGQIGLYRGAPDTTGELLYAFYSLGIDQPTSAGLDVVIPMEPAWRQDLLAGGLYLDVLTGQPGGNVRGQLLAYPNAAPEVSRVLAPAEGTVLVIGSAAGADPVDPAAPITTITLAPASDPDGQAVAYYWQASRDPSFGGPGTVTRPVDPDSRSLSLTVADLAEAFDAAWIGFPLPLQTPVTFYHRALTTDGARGAFGEASTLTLVRGTITANEPETGLPEHFALHGNYPNPFNPTTTIVFDLPETASVTVEVFNLLGERVLRVAGGTLAPGGRQRVEVDASRLASGTYLYRLVARTATGVHVDGGRLLLVK